MLVSETGTRVILIDRIHQFVDKSNLRIQHYLSDWLTGFLNDTGVTVVFSRLQSAFTALDQNEQLRGRPLFPAYLSRFDWNDENQESEFVVIKNSIKAALEDYIDLLEMADVVMDFRFY